MTKAITDGVGIPDSSMDVLASHVAVTVDIRAWSGRKKLVAEDLGLDAGSTLPPESVATLGSKRLVNPDQLKVFGSLRSRVSSELDRLGSRFLGAWLVPVGSLRAVTDMLETESKIFEKEKADFLGRYRDSLDQWAGEHPEWASMLARNAADVEAVSAAFSFGWASFSIGRVAGRGVDDKAANRELERSVAALGQTLFYDIRDRAREVEARVLAGRTSVTHRALRPVRTLRDKVHGLRGTCRLAAPVVSFMDCALGMLPPSGGMDGTSLEMLRALVCILQSPQELAAAAWRISNDEETDTVVRETLARKPAVDAVGDEAMDEEFDRAMEEAAETSDLEAQVDAANAAVGIPGGLCVASLGLW